MKTKKTKLIAGVVTLLILTLLLVLGPAQAFILGLSISNTNPDFGEIINFIVSTELEPSDDSNVTLFILHLTGPDVVSCSFLPNGTKISESACPGLGITQLSSPSFGYGYATGAYSFNITLDTIMYSLGLYETELVVETTGEDLSKTGENILISDEQAALINSCSVRAFDGTLLFDETSSTKNKVNFNIPLKNAANDGRGFVISQSKGSRFAYRFDFVKVLDNNPKNATLLTLGYYSPAPGKKISANAILYLDKIGKKVNIKSKDFRLDNSQINLMKGC